MNITTALSDGLLSFPITDFDKNGNFSPKNYAERLAWFVSKDISSVFVAGGTGEFFSLSKKEYRQIVDTAAEVVNRRMPVIASVGRSVPEASEFAKIAEDAGMDGLLLMPPYLTECPADGVIEYAQQILESTHLPVIFYNRANGVLSASHIQKLADACPNLVALKDGTGNMQDLTETVKTIGNRLIYIGGVPTAEIISEAYLSIGVNTYSSAVFNFVPDLAVRFYKALRAGEGEVVSRILREFFVPFVQLRSRKHGYAVSLIKAGARLVGKDAGNVRAPLVMPSEAECRSLQSLIEKAEKLAA